MPSFEFLDIPKSLQMHAWQSEGKSTTKFEKIGVWMALCTPTAPVDDEIIVQTDGISKRVTVLKSKASHYGGNIESFIASVFQMRSTNLECVPLTGRWQSA